MASGRLGTPADLSAATLTTIYTVPADNFAVTSINILNRGASAATVRLALAATDTPTNAEYIEYDVSIPAKAVLERTGLALAAGQKLVVYSDVTSVSVVAYGIETSAA
jgi:pyruvate dehydrogenase complex dehydrogenase (E1) component